MKCSWKKNLCHIRNIGPATPQAHLPYKKSPLFYFQSCWCSFILDALLFGAEGENVVWVLFLGPTWSTPPQLDWKTMCFSFCSTRVLWGCGPGPGRSISTSPSATGLNRKNGKLKTERARKAAYHPQECRNQIPPPSPASFSGTVWTSESKCHKTREVATGHRRWGVVSERL
jgi:hypothetical protein